ncbi:MAG: serine hydrolase [Syntrophothermus sp.]
MTVTKAGDTGRKTAWRHLPGLEARIKAVIKKSKGQVGVAAKDLVTGETVLVNAEESFIAASIIKVPVMIEVYRQVRAGRLRLDQMVELKPEDKVGGAGILMELHNGIQLTLEDLVVLMIVISDNTATNMLIDLVGAEDVNRTMEALGARGTVLRRKLMILELIEKGIQNYVTPLDILMLLEKMAAGQIVDAVASAAMLEIMKRQQYNEKIPKRLPEGLVIAHKTGEISTASHDVGVVYAPGGPMALCVMTQGISDIDFANESIAEISRLIYMAFMAGRP